MALCDFRCVCTRDQRQIGRREAAVRTKPTCADAAIADAAFSLRCSTEDLLAQHFSPKQKFKSTFSSKSQNDIPRKSVQILEMPEVAVSVLLKPTNTSGWFWKLPPLRSCWLRDQRNWSSKVLNTTKRSSRDFLSPPICLCMTNRNTPSSSA
jgi:hypothetical protein